MEPDRRCSSAAGGRGLNPTGASWEPVTGRRAEVPIWSLPPPPPPLPPPPPPPIPNSAALAARPETPSPEAERAPGCSPDWVLKATRSLDGTGRLPVPPLPLREGPVGADDGRSLWRGGSRGVPRHSLTAGLSVLPEPPETCTRKMLLVCLFRF